MRTAGLPDFRKLWGCIDEGLAQGQYNLVVNNYFDPRTFDGTKSIVLSTAGDFGGKNEFLAIAYLVVGAMAILISAFFCIKKRFNKSFGDKKDD